MDKFRLHAGIRWLFVVLTVVAMTATLRGEGAALRGQASYDELPPCEVNKDLFPPQAQFLGDKRNPVERWKDEFNKKMNDLVRAHLASAEKRTTCTSSPTVEATDEERMLALRLSPWKDGAALTASDFSAVVLEYLRAYTCTLNGRASMMMSEVAWDAEEEDKLGSFDLFEPGSEDPLLYTIAMEARREELLVKEELAIAPRTVHRLLRYVAALDRLRPVEASLRCLERASLDIRNILALNADASACMEARKGQSSLRDLAP